MHYYLAHEKKEIARLKKEARKLPDEEGIKLICLAEEKEVALDLVKAHIAAAKKLNGALG